MACQAAFATFELLEAFLAGLEFNDLLAACAVSKKWQSVIEQSLPLRRILYVTSASNTPLEVDVARMTLSTEPCAPLFTQAVISTNPFWRTPDYDKWPHFGEETRELLTLDPRCDVLSDSTMTFYCFRWSLNSMDGMAGSIFLTSMFLTQPPCTAVALYVRVMKRACADRPAISSATLRAPDGIRLGTIVDAIAEMLRGFEGEWRDLESSLFIQTDSEAAAEGEV
ncbi:hypothetical protein LTR56_007920 [Elasticomyces elasticus]|nr:hypothetical protein LTR22_022537 [Elasticomyces elasticus]KAK3647691.1 hypothetical protein LTR56_007920 [Elasticomyces elasticus]KAK4908108.1 hypothetical protein LTR49_022942 [Elasticomyces elasticus]KAK5738522.1 hypothetical protein LTS12_025563 [Elasticomyces elasticus]